MYLKTKTFLKEKPLKENLKEKHLSLKKTFLRPPTHNYTFRKIIQTYCKKKL